MRPSAPIPAAIFLACFFAPATEALLPAGNLALCMMAIAPQGCLVSFREENTSTCSGDFGANQGPTCIMSGLEAAQAVRRARAAPRKLISGALNPAVCIFSL